MERGGEGGRQGWREGGGAGGWGGALTWVLTRRKIRKVWSVTSMFFAVKSGHTHCVSGRGFRVGRQCLPTWRQSLPTRRQCLSIRGQCLMRVGRKCLPTRRQCLMRVRVGRQCLPTRRQRLQNTVSKTRAVLSVISMVFAVRGGHTHCVPHHCVGSGFRSQARSAPLKTHGPYFDETVSSR